MSKSSPAENIGSFPRRFATTRRFTLGAPRSFTLAEDGGSALFLRSSGADDAKNSLWLVRPESGPQVIFDATGAGGDDLTDAERARRERMREQAAGVVSYSARPDCSEVVFALGGALHQVDTASAATTELASDGNAFDPRFEPGEQRVAYVSGPSLRLTDGSADVAIPGTHEDDPMISWGSAEFVAAEEMGRGRGYWWSPDGGHMVACRVDTSPVEEWWISSPDTPASAPRAIRYPAAGTANATVQLHVIDVATGPTVEIDWTRGEFEYLADVQWGKRLLLTVQTRDQRSLAILEANPETGETTEVQRITDAHWVELQPNTPLDSELGIVMVVDDRTRRLMIDTTLLDHGDWNVRALIGVHHGVSYATVTSDGTDSMVAEIGSDGAVELLTDVGTFSSATANGGSFAITTASANDDTSYEIRWASGQTSIIESFADVPGFDCTPTLHQLGPRHLNAAVCLPSGHDGSPLPVLLDPYGGPHAQRVLKVRNAYATSQWFAEQGFAVVVIDGRGTPGKGPAFEREIWGDFASKVLDDQIDGLHALAELHPELDLTRVGIRGWSFGGYLAALAVMRRPDAVHAAVAGAPVIDWELYDTHYTERYLGHPADQPGNYEQSSVLTDAPKLTRPLMLIHGLADDNVVAAHTLKLSQALLEAGRPHEVLPLSGVTHMTPQEQVAENLLHLQRDFLLGNL